jgi:hypothetical protein
MATNARSHGEAPASGRTEARAMGRDVADRPTPFEKPDNHTQLFEIIPEFNF